MEFSEPTFRTPHTAGRAHLARPVPLEYSVNQEQSRGPDGQPAHNAVFSCFP